MKRRQHCIILGCKVNAYETEAMQELLEKTGYEIVDRSKTGADVYVSQYMHSYKHGRP